MRYNRLATRKKDKKSDNACTIENQMYPLTATISSLLAPKAIFPFPINNGKAHKRRKKLVFKSVRVLPGHEFIRIYEGKMAVVNFLANVQRVVEGHDVNLKVRRLKVYHKMASGGCRVAGQGTEVDEKLFPVATH